MATELHANVSFSIYERKFLINDKIRNILKIEITIV